MKTINSKVLLEDLQADVRRIITAAGELKQRSMMTLEAQSAPGQWSVAQVLEHLNIYCRFYLPAIENKLHLHQNQSRPQFKPGWLGDYFTKLMLPRQDNTIARKMKAPKNAIPASHPDAHQMLEEFINHQHQLLLLLQVAATADLQKIRIPISISRMIRLKLGDTLRFVIAHQQRHFLQIQNIYWKGLTKLPTNTAG
ncbi:DinB family protein [Chitinophaga pendula]|uniref:DinB family protein n=1 Tax=Chitinophaga TaxID=79328 RepID=UPI000BB08D0A|nr:MULTISPECIES: DinB family protein [Chitinophaga]ASZ13310.1 hypothetical protein CK934_21275 [Chitinophaga sp. MD30]UCJ09065.1 DinB family protein [Chitinophaga pendula]